MKRLFLSCCLAAGLALASPAATAFWGAGGAVVSAAETTPSTETPATEAATLSTEAPAVSGWQQDATGWFYLQNGAKVTGWQDLGGNRYYFDASGYRVSGSYRVDGTYYLFRPETETEYPGALYTGASGLVSFASTPDVLYYLTSAADGSLTTSKWIKNEDGYYYSNKKGQIKLGTIRVKKKYYHITQNGRMTFYGKSTYDNSYYYAGKNGVLKTGFQTIGGLRYYFDPVTGKRASGVTKIGDDTYYFRKNGAIRTGWVKKQGGTRYYYDSLGRRVSGWCTVKGRKYYLDPQNDDTRVENCWKVINGKTYYFNASGVLQTGFFTVDGNRYFANANGVRKSGWKKINGRKYYIDPTTYIVKTGWFTYKSKTYYLNPNPTASYYGAATTGFVNILTKNGKKKFWYYFNNDGSMYTGWLSMNGSRYYFNPANGRMFTGKHTIGGQEYDFGKNGACASSTPVGPWRIEVNRRGCFIVVYRGNTPVRAFVCSTAADGVSTPTGTFYIMDKLRWHELQGPSWGQFCSHLTPDILFHSVPNYQQDNHTLETAQYNKLGSPASAGCIRLTVKHAKYLYDNCPIGTPVTISDSVARPTGIVIETAPKIPLTQNYDPTDPYA